MSRPRPTALPSRFSPRASSSRASPRSSSTSRAAPSSSCSTNPDGSRTCSISFQAPTGLDTFAIAAYDQAPVNGQIPSGANLLSAGSAANQNIVAGQVNTVTVSLGGQVASIAVAPAVLLAVANQQAQSYPLSVEPLDADNYIIIPLVGQTPFNNGTLSVGVSSGDPNHTISIVPSNPSRSNGVLGQLHRRNHSGRGHHRSRFVGSIGDGQLHAGRGSTQFAHASAAGAEQDRSAPGPDGAVQRDRTTPRSRTTRRSARFRRRRRLRRPIGGAVSFTVAASNSGRVPSTSPRRQAANGHSRTLR